MSEKRQTNPFSGPAVIEMFGHRRLGGYVTEQEIAGHGFVRVEVYGTLDLSIVATQYLNPSSIYSLTPCTAEAAQAVAAANQPEPVHRWELPRPAEVPTVDKQPEYAGGAIQMDPDEFADMPF